MRLLLHPQINIINVINDHKIDLVFCVGVFIALVRAKGAFALQALLVFVPVGCLRRESQMCLQTWENFFDTDC